MEPTDLTIDVLKNSRDEVRKTNEHLEGLEGEARGMKSEQVETNTRLGAVEKRLTDTEVRLSTALADVVGTLNDVKTLLRENYSSTFKDHERRITTLEARLNE